MRISIGFMFAALLLSLDGLCQSSLKATIATRAQAIEQKVITWRQDIHQHPELGNQEVRTAEIISRHLKQLGMEVQEKVAVTGIVGILKGGKPGPVIALRADMDALPVTERTDVPFRSKVTTVYNGQTTGVMHACGHDAHVAILMGVAEVLASLRNELSGTIKFIFQPAEEGVSGLETFGARQMVEEGVLENPKVEAIFGLHVRSNVETGMISYRSGATMAAMDQFMIKVKGKQSHGARPWTSIDPIVTSAQIVSALQTIVSRNVDITEHPATVSVGAIHGGLRQNIIPESVEMIGTIRTFSEKHQQLIHRRIREIAANIAQSAGAQSDVGIDLLYPVTYNDPQLTEKMVPTLKEVAGEKNIIPASLQTGAEDFSFYQKNIPGLFFFLGCMPKGKDPDTVGPHHTPDFYLDESSFLLGIKALANLSVDYLQQPKSATKNPLKRRK